MTRVRFPSLLFVVMLWCSAACTQGEGELCQVDDDCSDGLECCIGGSTTRGTCTTKTACANDEDTGDASTAE